MENIRFNSYPSYLFSRFQMSSAKEVEAKVTRYETFLNEILRTDLRKTLLLRDNIYKEQAEYLALRNSINAIKISDLVPGEPLKTKVDLGCNFYCQARIQEPGRICVSIGLGFFLEMTLDEALEFLDRKDEELSKEAERLTEDCAKLKANVKIVLGGLREIQNINPEEPRKLQRDIFS